MFKQCNIITSVFFLFFFFLLNFLSASDYEINLEKISRGIWIYNPNYNDIKDKIIVSNIGVIEGEKFTMIIDSGNSSSFSAKFLNEVKKVISTPIKFLIITHRHFDHSFGIETFIKKKIDIYMDENEFEMLKKEGDLVRRMIFPKYTKKNKIIDTKNILNSNIKHLENEKFLDLGNRKVLIKNVGIAHTRGDIIVYDFNSKIYFSGDIVFEGAAATFSDANVKIWLDKYERIFNLPWKLMLPGHGKLIRKKIKLNDTKFWLIFLDNTITRALNEGDMISEVLDIDYPEELKNIKNKDITFKRGLKKQMNLYEEKYMLNK